MYCIQWGENYLVKVSRYSAQWETKNRKLYLSKDEVIVDYFKLLKLYGNQDLKIINVK